MVGDAQGHKRILRNLLWIVPLVLILALPVLTVLHFVLVRKAMSAVESGNLRMVTAITAVDPWVVNAKTDIDPIDDTPLLTLAAWRGHTDVARRLIACGADLNAATWDGMTALQSAVVNNRFETAQVLLKSGADPDRGSFGCTALHSAVEAENLKMVELLLRNGADINASRGESWTPLHVAAGLESPDILVALLKHGADPNVEAEHGGTAIWQALDSGRLENYKLLRQHGCTEELPRIFEASATGDLEAVRLAVRDDPKSARAKGKAGCTPLSLAIANGHVEIVRYLLDQGVSPDVSALQSAVDSGHVQVAGILVARGADVNEVPADSRSNLHTAVDNNDKEMVEFLLAHGADRNDVFQGQTPLDLAERLGYDDIAAVLR